MNDSKLAAAYYPHQAPDLCTSCGSPIRITGECRCSD